LENIYFIQLLLHISFWFKILEFIWLLKWKSSETGKFKILRFLSNLRVIIYWYILNSKFLIFKIISIILNVTQESISFMIIILQIILVYFDRLLFIILLTLYRIINIWTNLRNRYLWIILVWFIFIWNCLFKRWRNTWITYFISH